MGIWQKFALQFGNPQGFLGRVAGTLMSKAAAKNEWTLSLLQLRSTDNLLEMGFGPGVAIRLASKEIQHGKIVGIDFSEAMLKQARKRNKEAIKEGRVELKLADINDLPPFDLVFDKVFSVNSIIFWKDPVESLQRVRPFIKPNGKIAITVQPFVKGATEETAEQFGKEIIRYLQEAGYSELTMELKYMKPITAVCVLGTNR